MKKERIFSSNALRLSGRELIVTALIVFPVFFFLLPFVWGLCENISADKNFRLAYDYRDDYWIYRQWAEKAVKKYPFIFLGDSVIWGMYVDNNNTLPAQINRKLHRDEAANLAIDGLHSLALEGLLEYYSGSIKNKKVVLHYNPLWMNSRKYDLSGKEELRVNHPRLIPQFSPRLKCYTESFGNRMAIWRERNIPFFSLLNHVRVAFFDNEEFSRWIIDHPYANPFAALSMNFPAGEKEKTGSTIDWTQKGIPKQDWDWLMPDESLQWQAFTRNVEKLRQSGNELLVIVGPINPYLLSDKSLKRYRKLQKRICEWLQNENIKYYLAPDMPSNTYADASHPLASGYELIADGLLKTGFFK